MATSTQQNISLDDLGAIARGYRADVVVFDHLSRFQIKKVFKDGLLVAENGEVVDSRFRKSLLPIKKGKRTLSRIGTLRIKTPSQEGLTLRSRQPQAKVIQLIPNQIITRKAIREIPLKNQIAHPNVKEDILKIVVVERHRATGNIGIGFVEGFGLKKGAIGSTVAHDSHNLVIVGTNDQDILTIIDGIESIGGGMAVVSDGKILASLSLPIAGLMSEASVQEVNQQLEKLNAAAKKLGCKVPDPFMILSFLSLPVIPELKLTDKGLVDVNQFKIVPLFGKE
jgi:adenine deaminase